MTRIPIYDDGVPIACTADSTELAQRIETVERMRASMRAVERTEHGVLLHFPADAAVAAEVRRFTVDEQGCCAFWGFEVHEGPDGLTLRWEGPPSEVITVFFDELVAAFEGDEPLTAFAGLL